MLSILAKKTGRAAVSRSVISRGFAAKEIKFGIEGRAAMLKGVNTLADAVEVGSFVLFSLLLLWLFSIGLKKRLGKMVMTEING